MEYWGPTSNTSLDVSLARVKESHIYVGIIGTRYGSIVNEGKSVTQLEYEQAVSSGLERLVYLIDEKEHPIVLEHVDTGENAEKLKKFKNLISQSLRGTFKSSDDLTSQIVTHIIQYLDRVGQNIQIALLKNGIKELPLVGGYSYGMESSSINMAPYLEMRENGYFVVENHFLQHITAAGIIAQNLKDGNFRILDNFVTFEPVVWKSLVFLLREFGLDEKVLASAISKGNNALRLRLLIGIAGATEAVSCIEPICNALIFGQKHQNLIKQHDIQVTPFYDTILNALNQMPKSHVVPVVYKYLEIAKREGKWQQKRILETVLKQHGESLKK